MPTVLVQHGHPGDIYSPCSHYPKRVWIWRGTGATVAPTTFTVRHPGLLYARFGGAHGQVFVWDRARSGGVVPPTPPTGGRHPFPSWMRRWWNLDMRN